MYFIEVVLPIPLLKTFTYSVNVAEFEVIQPGIRAAVPFGKNKIYSGLVVSKHHDAPENYQAKEIHQLLDEEPIVNAQQLLFWRWIAQYYMVSIGEVYRAAVPSFFLLESETILKCSSLTIVDVEDSSLKDDEYLLLQALQKQSVLRIEEVVKVLGKKNVFPIIKKLLEKKLIQVEEEIFEEYKPKKQRYLQLNQELFSEVGLAGILELTGRSNKQKEVLLKYFQLTAQSSEPISVKYLIEKVPTNSTILKSLIDKNILQEYFLQEDRIDYSNQASYDAEIIQKNNQEAFAKIKEQHQQKSVVVFQHQGLLQNISLYIQLINDYLEQQKQVLYLVPEIVMVPEILQALQQVFSDKLVVYHSRFNNNEKVEIWNRILHQPQKAQLIIGTRSSIFLPFSDLGLVIVEDEHDAAYKQNEPAPRYHTRDCAIMLAHQHQAKVVLASASPSMESYYQTQQNKYGLVVQQSPELSFSEAVALSNLQDLHKRKRMTGHFGEPLIEAVNQALEQKQQVVLFQNRRGFAPIVECETCGHVPQCSHCNVSLTYHKSKNQLSCHYCGYAMPKPTHCHSCSSTEINLKGLGTEQVEAEAKELFPQAKIVRMDQDTTRGKFSFQTIIEDFKNKEIDILIGTQMIAKGIDFSEVSLTGVLNADNLLYHPDFRSFERTYQMLSQLAQQTQTGNQKGKIIIQTYHPAHPILQKVVKHDYQGMYQEQLAERKEYVYPPFCRLIKVTFKHKDFAKLKEAAQWFYQVLVQQVNVPIYGPEEPSINRIRNQYIRIIQIKIPLNYPLTQTKNSLQKTINSFEAVPAFKSVYCSVNVDYV